jgi:hypothetical protein
MATTTAPASTTPAPTTPPLIEKPFFAFDNESRAARQRWKKTYDAHLSCFGAKAFTHSTTFGTLTGWIIIGDLADTATSLQTTFSRLIDAKIQEGPQARPYYVIRCFLLGIKESHAAPHVVILCCDDKFSQKLRGIIIGSKILSAHPNWYCFRLPYETFALTLSAASSNITNKPEHVRDLGFLSKYEVFIDLQKNPQVNINSAAAEIWKDDVFVGTSTLGGVIEANGHSFALTVAHAFYSYKVPESPPFCVDETELGFFSEVESDADDSLHEVLGPGLGVSLLQRNHPSEDFHLLRFEQKKRIGHLAWISDLTRQSNESSSGLDWALIGLDSPDIRMMNSPLLTL